MIPVPLGSVGRAARRFAAIPLLLIWGTTGCTPGLDGWGELRELEVRLREAEAPVYLPRESFRFERSLRTIDAGMRPALRPIDMACGQPLLERSIAWQIERGRELLDETASLRVRMQADLEASLMLLRLELAEARASIHHSELEPVIEEMEAALSAPRDFSGPEAYLHNVRVMNEIAELYRKLQARRLRYDGGRVSLSEMWRHAEYFERAREAAVPAGNFILIDTAANRLYLRNGNQVLLDAACSTGSGYRLVGGGREWVFDTPRGEFVIERKIRDPIWRKPDWAFIETGRPVPRRERDRLKEQALGEYALGFGDGYFIHGTLYTRLLGEPVTHGCIRLGSDDLVRLAELVGIGTKVYIF
jgi:L,D-transpeptidase ErfK/SrfK